MRAVDMIGPHRQDMQAHPGAMAAQVDVRNGIDKASPTCFYGIG